MRLSNLLFISMFRFKKNMIGYVLAGIEILIAVILFINVLSSVRYYQIPIKAFENVESSRLLYYGYNKIEKSEEDLKAAVIDFENYAADSPDIARTGRTGLLRMSVLKESVQGKGFEQISGTSESGADDPYYAGSNALIYDRLIAEKFPLVLEKGKQLTEYETDNGCVPVILHSKYMKIFHVGDQFNIRLQWTNNNETGEYEICETALAVQIAGFLNRSNYHTEIGAGGSFFTADMLVTNEFECDMIILRDSDAVFPVDSYHFQMSTFLIETSEGAGAAERIEDKLSSLGYVSSLGSIIDDSVYMLKQKTAGPIINLIIFAITAIAAIGGINGMNQIAQKKDFGIYYICGATWGDCIKTDIVRNLLVITVSSLLSFAASFFLFRFSETNVLSIWDFIAAVAMVAAIYLISSLQYIISLKKIKPADSVKEWED